MRQVNHHQSPALEYKKLASMRDEPFSELGIDSLETRASSAAAAEQGEDAEGAEKSGGGLGDSGDDTEGAIAIVCGI